MLLAFMLTMLGSATAFAADQVADLEAEMFKAWDSNLPGANVVAEPEPEPKSNNPFGCTYALYENVGAYGTIYGSPNVYCMWYADITGTKTMTVTGTPGMKIRLMLNRVPYVEGGTGDADGGAYIEWIETIGDDGQVVFDFTQNAEVVAAGYIHLNAIKVASGSPSGVVKAIQLYGSVKPVSGWVDMLNNGDLEGDDLESFPVSKDGPHNGDTANDRPEIVELNGVKCMKVTSDDLAALGNTETWSTQFYFKFNEMLEEGTQYRLVLDVCADGGTTITTSAQGAPRAWHAGFMDGFAVSSDWMTVEYEGTVTADQAKNGGFGSVAFDLNNEPTPINFYFKNAHFYIYKEKNALSQFTAGYQNDVVCVDLGENTNMKQLIQAAGGTRVIFPIDCASVKVDGQPTTLFSVEGKDDNKLFVFIDEGFSMEENAKVEVSFTNPADAAYHLTFTSGRYEGEDVPNWTDMLCAFQDGLGENFTYLADIPQLKSTDPEDGSFNLPLDMTTFKVTFQTNANAAKLTAKLGDDALTVSPSEGFATEFTLTHSGTITPGEHILFIDNVYPESDILGDEHFGSYEVTLNFGPVEMDPNDVEKDMIPASYFAEAANNSIPVGFKVVADNEEERVAPNTYSSGARVFSFAEGGDFVKGLYYRNNYVSFGEYEDYLLPLEEGKKYSIHFNTARWKASGQWTKFQIVNPSGDVEYEEVIENNPDTNGGTSNAVKGSTIFDKTFVAAATGNYILKWVCASNAQGDQGTYNENLLANVSMKYVPNVVGGTETRLLNTALENAKSVMEGNSAERYAGADYDALLALINQVEAEKAGYTAPSKYREMAAALDAAAQALKDHRAACDSYDANIKKTCDIVRQTAAPENGKQKFMNTESYTNTVALAEKYNATSGWQNVGTEEEPNWQLQYTYDVLTQNDSLATANAELYSNNTIADKMFTVGTSKCEMTGYAVLFERIRCGIETLKSLGVAEDDALIVAANNVLGDDDEMAESIKNLIKALLYGELKNADNKLFAEVVNEETLETTTPTYDMTVFLKNPNFYRTNGTSTDFTPENVPGWTTPEGFKAPGISVGWNDPCAGFAAIPSDCMTQTWGPAYRIEQTVTDLPAGVYTITFGFQERNAEADTEDCFAYTATSGGTAADTLTVACPYVGHSFPVDNIRIENVTVTDGKLTVGVNAGGHSHTFFNEAKLILTAPAAGFDYASAYEQAVQGIETEVADNARVIGIEIFDLNGRRMAAAQRGIQIVKKYMSNGTIRTEKVIIR